MTQKPSTFLNMLLTLSIVTAVAALSLGFVYEKTKEPIAQAKLEKQKRAIKAVTGDYTNDPLADAYVPEVMPQLTFYPVKNDGVVTSVAIKTFCNNGYSGRIELIVGVDTVGQIINVSVLDHKETPGLGSKISDPEFIGQFIGQTSSSMKYQVDKDGGDVDAISGATISSRSFTSAVIKALEAREGKKHGHHEE
jgi:electron transport complex protein RnfG